jgi:hypothetical protein
MKIGIPKEIHPGERRVAATPDTAKRLKSFGFDVIVESGAGAAAEFVNLAYTDVGCEIAADARSLWAAADIVLKVRPPSADEVLLLREGGTLISFIYPAQNKQLLDQLAARRATVLAMDAVPRISRAQKLDALSSMANISGYRASSRPPTTSAASSPARSPPPARSRRPRSSSSAPAWPASPRSASPRASARSSAPSTPARSSRSRSRAWAPSSCSSTSRRTAPARAATPSR